jgi:hypothetical protein
MNKSHAPTHDACGRHANSGKKNPTRLAQPSLSAHRVRSRHTQIARRRWATSVAASRCSAEAGTHDDDGACAASSGVPALADRISFS